MKRCLITESGFKRVGLSKKVQNVVAKLGRLTVVSVSLLVFASIVSADANALQGSAAKLAAIDQQQSQQTIATLAETVDNLSQQLSRRDQEIEDLEKQIDKLESDIGGDVHAQPLSSSEAESLSIKPLAVKQAVALWQWGLLCIFALSVSAYLLRARFYAKAQWTKLSNSNSNSSDQFESDNIMSQSSSDESPADAIDANAAINDKAAMGDIEELSFEQRFEQLLAEKDFAFARELLDFTRYNEINDERYHCERLRLLERMQDEDGFYAYYFGIESKIPSFPENLQTQISQLVVMLAQR